MYIKRLKNGRLGGRWKVYKWFNKDQEGLLRIDIETRGYYIHNKIVYLIHSSLLSLFNYFAPFPQCTGFTESFSWLVID